MKKLLVILALCMVFSVVLVACENTPDDPEETTPEVTTPEVTTPEETTPEVTTEETTEETTDVTTDETTTEEVTTEPTPEPVKVVIAKSWDSMYEIVDGYEGDAVFTDGTAYMTWEQNAVVDIDHTTEALRVWGWIAYATETEGTVGYSINGGEVIYNEAFTFTAEEGVQTHIKNNVPGAVSACRMKFDMPTADLKAGEYTFALVAKDPDGNEEVIKEFKVTKTMPYAENAHSNFSIDNISLNGNAYVTEGQVVAEMQAKNNTVLIMPTDAKESIGMRGWVAFAAAPAVECGYYIGKDVVIVTDAAYTQDRPDLATAGIVNGVGYNMTVSIADLPAGVYPVGVIAKLEDGTYAQFYSFTLQIVPECNEATVDLGIRTSGGPYSGEKKFGQKLPLGNNYLTGVTVKDMATYADGNVNTWSFKVWAWDTDYATTVAGTVLYELTGENHNDNTSFVVEIPFEKLITGDVYYEIEYLSGSAQFTGWAADEILVPGVETYVAGNLQEGTYGSSVKLAVPVVIVPPAEPKPPVAIGDAAYLAGQANNAGIGNSLIESAVVSEDGSYVTITSPGGDTFFWVLPGGANVEGIGAVTLKYRTTVDGGEEFDGEFFVGSGSITGGADEVRFEYINDGEWHVLVLDIASYLNAAGKVNYLRYDFFAGSAGSIDIAEIILFDTVVSANAHYGIVEEEPEAPAEDPYYALQMVQAKTGETLYFTGEMADEYLATSTDAAAAAKVYVEASENGLRQYVLVDGVKNYIEIHKNEKGKVRVCMTTEPQFYYVLDEEAGTYVINFEETNYYLGTFGDYTTIGCSSTYYITGDKAANVGVSQYVVAWVEYPAAE